MPAAVERHASSQSVVLSCVAYGAPFPNVTWIRLPGTELVSVADSVTISTNVTAHAEDDSGGFVTSTLELCDAQPTYSGNYRCSADNSVVKEAAAGSVSSWDFSLSVLPRGKETLRQ